jgi:predicted nucleic acid-binding protein
VRVVVDASVAVKWVLTESGSNAAVALRAEEMIAPSFWLVEAANALWRSARAGEITAGEADAFLQGLLNAPVASIPVEPHITAALRLAIELGHPIYDCLYLAVALHHDTHVVTADRRFAAAVATARPALADRVRLLETP